VLQQQQQQQCCTRSDELADIWSILSAYSDERDTALHR